LRRLPAEFEEQSFVQVIFPHKNSDWSCCLDEAEKNFIDIINAIAKYQACLVVCDDISYVKTKFSELKNLHFVEAKTNDTWARDCSAITLDVDGEPLLLDFNFNAWGNKYDASLDNKLTQNLASSYDAPIKKVDYVLEGGAIDSNGLGTILTTASCIFNENRNNDQHLGLLKKALSAEKIIVISNGHLSGDDTDGHIDTLARFVDQKTIAYVQCLDKEDEHFDALLKMEGELERFSDQNKDGFHLIPLPLPKAIYEDKKRLPATYANFLIINGAVLMPTYNDDNDDLAQAILQRAFPKHDIVPIDCSTLIRQGGSLHCVTMQFPKGVKLL
jgi:agmatine/peptidylarginine deiminase